jgi:diacylglycerol O-acyltransferase
MFLWLEGRRQPMHVGGLQLYTPPAGAGPDFVQKLVESWRESPHAQPPFDERVKFRLGHWFWEVDAEFELDYHFRHSALPRPGRIRELLSLVSRLHGTLMDRTRPLWECNVIEGLADGRVALYVKIHHAMMDGVAAMKLLQRTLSPNPDAEEPPLWARVRGPRPPREKSLDAAAPPSLFERALAAGAEILPGVQSGLRELVRAAEPESVEAQPFHAPPTMFNVRISGSRRFAAQSYELARFKSIGKAAGATVNDVTLAVCAGALRKYLQMHNALPDKPLIAMVPVSVRDPAAADGGNQISILLANLATHLEDPIERLHAIVDSTRVAKDRLSKMSRLERVAHAAAMSAPMGASMVTGYAKRRPIYNVVISNVPGPSETLYLDHMRLDETYPVSIPVEYLALNITITSYAGLMGFGFIACRKSVPALQRMLDHTDESLAELESKI